jgi:hypothetical protein
LIRKEKRSDIPLYKFASFQARKSLTLFHSKSAFILHFLFIRNKSLENLSQEVGHLTFKVLGLGGLSINSMEDLELPLQLVSNIEIRGNITAAVAIVRSRPHGNQV